jgi:hypothetical protein
MAQESRNFQRKTGQPRVLCGVVLGLGTLASTAPLVRSSRQTQVLSAPQDSISRPKINRKSKTDVLQVVGTIVTGGFVKLSLKNVSNKSINGVQLAINGGILQIEFLDADRPENQRLLPGAIYEETFPFNGVTPVEVAILAVTFDDKTSSGTTSLADQIFETRRGVKEVLTRFQSVLADARKSPDADSIVILERLKAQVNDLPEGDSKGSGSMRMGELQAKQEIIQEIEFIRDRLIKNPGLTTVRDSVSELETRHEQRLQAINTSTKQ